MLALEAPRVASPALPESISAEALRPRFLGERRHLSPLAHIYVPGGFVPDDARIPVFIEQIPGRPRRDDLLFEKAGPRERIYFDPSTVRAAVLTAGGLCPGLNNVIRSIVLQLRHGYGVDDIVGLRFGYLGLDPTRAMPPLALTNDVVADIHRLGGTTLGTSREYVAPEVALDFLQSQRIRVLFTIGGDGTLRGAHALFQEASRRGYEIAVIAIPKTIDNDIPYVWRSFGYFTALEKAREVIDAAHSEAKSHFNGVGLVRLMGREAGYIAAGATLASQEVNFTLIPEVPFALEGPQGFLEALRQRIARRAHAVVVVAEGAGQDLIPDDDPQYRPRNGREFKNIGLFLRDQILRHCDATGTPVDIKYFDPAYFIRSAPADSEDALLCDQLARNAVHAAMAGKTDTLIGTWYNVNTHVPIELASAGKKRIAEEDEIWRSVLQTTGQPARLG
jgi:6-phosphofructokinase 1